MLFYEMAMPMIPLEVCGEVDVRADSPRSMESILLPLAEHFLHTTPLAGLPTTVMVDNKPTSCGPNLTARRAAITYCLLSGVPPRNLPRDYVKLDKTQAVVVADLYESLNSSFGDPSTLASYEALIRETLAQYQVIKATGLKVEYNPTCEGHPDPYSNPRRLMTDVSENNHLFVTDTLSAFGETSLGLDQANPLLREATGELISGRVPLVNDILRIVHDYFGHVREGLGFRVQGEFNAWRGHIAMYSALAGRALTTEMLGQNCWINYGPYGESNRKADVLETRYGEQKVGLLPEWVAQYVVGECKDGMGP